MHGNIEVSLPEIDNFDVINQFSMIMQILVSDLQPATQTREVPFYQGAPLNLPTCD